MDTVHLLVASGLVSLVVLSFVVWVRRAYPRRPIPPGPLQGLKTEPWKAYAEWSKTLGPLVTSSTVGRPLIVVNTVEAALQLLEKRSHFACKPRWPMAELLGRQKNVGFQYYGERWKKSRKVYHGALNRNAVSEKWSDLLESQSLQLVSRFLHFPEAFYADTLKGVEEFIVCFAYGRKPDTEFHDLARSVMSETGIALQPGRWMVNKFPALAYVPSWVPGAGFKRWAAAARDAFYRLTRDPFRQVQLDMVQGKAQPSFVRNALEASQRTPEDEDVIMSAAGSLYSAGTDTTSAAILTFVLLLTRSPDVQERAYDEIMRVVGPDRLPDLRDRDSLPYLDCVMQEVFRFNPPIPLLTRSNSKEDEYLGWRIPQKSWIVGNLWAMTHNEAEYPQPEEFIPERFIPRKGCTPPRDPRTLTYGFGRRICPGMHLSNDYLFLVASRLLACYELRPQQIDGQPSLPPLDFVVGLVPTPKPFECVLVPRAKTSELLRLAE